MNDADYTEVKEMFGDEYADSLREAIHTGNLKRFLVIRKEVLENGLGRDTRPEIAE